MKGYDDAVDISNWESDGLVRIRMKGTVLKSYIITKSAVQIACVFWVTVVTRMTEHTVSLRIASNEQLSKDRDYLTQKSCSSASTHSITYILSWIDRNTFFFDNLSSLSISSWIWFTDLKIRKERLPKIHVDSMSWRLFMLSTFKRPP